MSRAGGIEWVRGRPELEHTLESEELLTSLRPAGEEAADLPPSLPHLRMQSEPAPSCAGTVQNSAQAQLSHEGDPDFVLGEMIGQGGMGLVRAATQVALRRAVAVKTLHQVAREQASTLHTRSSARRALLREAVITGRLEHPSIVPVHLLGLDERGEPVLVMKRVEGVSWRTLIREPGHPTFGSGDPLLFHLRVLRRICDAVHFAHERHVVHRDLKPDNVIVGHFGEVYVLDWGIALPLDARDQYANEGLVGTPAYLAPEMLEIGATHVTKRTDVYLLGGLLHEVLTGAVPHAGRTVLDALADADVSDPFAFGPKVPRGLVAIVHRAMARNAESRFPTALAFKQALEQYLETRNSIALSDEAEVSVQELESLIKHGVVHDSLAPSGEAGTARTSFDPLLAYKLFGACRFGFLQASKISADNHDATTGLHRAIEAMARYELSKGHADAANALLTEHPTPPPSLTREIARLRLQQSQVADELHILRQQAHAGDVRVGSRLRAQIALSAAVVFQVLALAWVASGRLPATYPRAIVFASVFATLVIIASRLTRRASQNEATQRLFVALAVVALITVVHRLSAYQRGLALEQALTDDLMLYAVGGASVACTMDWRVLFPTVWLLGWATYFSFRVTGAAQYGPLVLSGAVMVLGIAWRFGSDPPAPAVQSKAGSGTVHSADAVARVPRI